MAKVRSVNISEKKGTIKKPVEKIVLNGQGVKGDAHAGVWHRQVSLLGKESVDKFSLEAGRDIACGEFAENITTEGITLYEMSPLDRISIGEVKLQVTQIGKKCHGSSCAIFREVGNCVMPKEGIFCRVLRQGEVSAGQEIVYEPYQFRARVITLSDRASRGEYEDRSGPRAKELLERFFAGTDWKAETGISVIPDHPADLRELLTRFRDEKIDLVITTGGTGIGPRDITPEVAREIMDKEVPGIMEAIRIQYGMEKPAALLSRGVAGVMDKTLLFCIPGSVRAVNEYMEEITKHIRHMIFMLHGIDMH